MGMIAGAVVGATAAMVAMPYIRPQIKRAFQRGKSAIDTQMNKIESMN